jgi:CelD/BcsL family acetyltransferase involved in cellulose biosynthesis
MWRALEARADGSFFQSWSWVGCQAAARFPHPRLLTAQADGRVLALGLFNRRRGALGPALWLNASGDAALDAPHVEYNGLLLARDAPPGLLAAAMRRLLAEGAVVLPGTDLAHRRAAAATGAFILDRAHPSAARWIDLGAVRAHPDGHLGLLSANTRQQLRRALRAYGPLAVESAATLDQAQDWLAALAVLHQQTWTARGKPGAFALPGFTAFHGELLATAWPRGEIDLLRITAGADIVGYLYNFVWRGRVANYQSGFAYAAAEGTPRKPGLTCHHLATQHYAAAGMAAYDLLAGEARYKSSLTQHATDLHWIEALPPWSLAALAHRTRAALKR